MKTVKWSKLNQSREHLSPLETNKTVGENYKAQEKIKSKNK